MNLASRHTPAINMKTTSIRRQRKDENREKLLQAFRNRCAVSGFEETTLESVAREAGFHVQTLYRHFPRKKDLLIASWEQNLEEFERFMAEREKDALTTWRDWVELNARRSQTDPHATAIPIPEMDDYWHRYETLLAVEIAQDLNIDPLVDMKPTLLACMLVGANKHAAYDLLASGHTTNWVADLLNVVDEAVQLFADSQTPKNS